MTALNFYWIIIRQPRVWSLLVSPHNGSIHYKISSQLWLLGWLVTGLLSVHTFDFYALDYIILPSITMSVAFTPHRQRGKGDITPAGIQKVIHLFSATQNGGSSISVLAVANDCSSARPGWLNRSETILQGQSAVNMNVPRVTLPRLHDRARVDLTN